MSYCYTCTINYLWFYTCEAAVLTKVSIPFEMYLYLFTFQLQTLKHVIRDGWDRLTQICSYFWSEWYSFGWRSFADVCPLWRQFIITPLFWSVVEKEKKNCSVSLQHTGLLFRGLISYRITNLEILKVLSTGNLTY